MSSRRVSRARVLALLVLAAACDSDPLPGASGPDAGGEADARLADAGADQAAAMDHPPADAAPADTAAAETAAPVDAAPALADAGADAAPAGPDGPAPFACLPDGSGRITLRTSGGLTIAVASGNQEFCSGSVSEDQKDITLLWVVPAQGTELNASVHLDIKGVTKGETFMRKPASVTVAIAGELGNIWQGEGLCTADLTMNAVLAPPPEPGTTRYKVAGAARCSGPLPGLKPSSLLISEFSFTTGVVYPAP